MTIRQLLVIAALVVIVALGLVFWLIPFVMRTLFAVFALLLVYAGVRILIGPSTVLPETRDGDAA